MRRVATLCLLLTVAYTNALFDGNNTAYSQYPWFASIVFVGGNTAWLCGGSLVSSSVLLTAGHCVQGAVEAYVYLNSSVNLNPYTPGVSLYTTQFISSTAYSGPPLFQHDMAFVVLPIPSSVPPMKVANASEWSNVGACALLTVMGRGETCAGGCLDNTLQVAQMPKIPAAACLTGKTSTDWSSTDVGDDFCVGFKDSCRNTIGPEGTGVETCPGDSGGPLFLNGVIYGVVSRGDTSSCGASQRADIFTSLVDATNTLFANEVISGQAFNLSVFTSPTSNAQRHTPLFLTYVAILAVVSLCL